MAEEKLIRVHIQLYERDWDRLEQLYGGKIKRSAVVREVIRKWIATLEERAQRRTERARTE